MVAEKRAAEKIAEARKRKQKRLKQAKEEAQAEVLPIIFVVPTVTALINVVVQVEKYKVEREAAFKEYEKAHLGNKEDISARIAADTNAQLLAMDKTVVANQEQATTPHSPFPFSTIAHLLES